MAESSKETVRPVPAIDLGHSRVDRFLDMLRREGVPSLLFTGPEGSGKEYTAIEFARKLCCERKPECDPGGEVCGSCARAAGLEHPGIHLIYPTPTQGSGEDEEGDVTDIAGVLVEKRRDIFARHRFSRKTTIRVARARAVIQRANTKPFGSSHSVFIFIDAHAMREEAQNAMLKLVEEPPAHCVLIFVTPNPEGILYTVRSRCQHVRFTPLATEALERVLVQYYGVEPERARRAALLSQGSLDRARGLIESLDQEEREAAVAFAAGLPDATESWVIGQALAMSRGGNREGVARFLHELSLVFRDVMAGDRELLLNRDNAESLGVLARRWDRKRLPSAIDRITRARYEVLVRNMNIDAAMVALFRDLRRGM